MHKTREARLREQVPSRSPGALKKDRSTKPKREGSTFLCSRFFNSLLGLAGLGARDIKVGDAIGDGISIDSYGWNDKGVIAIGFLLDDRAQFVVHFSYMIIDLVKDATLGSTTFDVGYAGLSDGMLESTKKDSLREFSRLSAENGIRPRRTIQFFPDNPVIIESGSYRVSVDYDADSASGRDQGVDVNLPFTGLGKLNRYSIQLEKAGGGKKVVTSQDKLVGTIEELRYVGVVKSPLENRIAVVMAERSVNADGESVTTFRIYGSHLSVGF